MTGRHRPEPGKVHVSTHTGVSGGVGCAVAALGVLGALALGVARLSGLA